MSYDVWLEIDTGGEYPARVTESRNQTYNLHYAIEYGGLSVYPLEDPPACSADESDSTLFVLAGALATDAAVALERAIKKIEQDRMLLAAQEPANGWGSVNGLLDWLEGLRQDCLEHPKARVGCS